MSSLTNKSIVFDPARYLNPAASYGSSSIRSIRRRPYVFLVLALLAVFVLSPLRPPLPPSYKEEWNVEKYLPQVDPEAHFPEGRNGRYVRFRPIKETGFNYQLQSLILQQQIAFMANRSLAYEPYHSVDSIFPVSLTRWPLRSSRIPMSALLHSISNGFEALYGIPRAVPVRYYDRICPRSKTRRVSFASLMGTAPPPRDRNVKVAHLDYETDVVEGSSALNGETKMRRMAEFLKGEEEHGCIEVVENPFDRDFFETHAPVEMYDLLATSPVLKHFAFSPRVLSIINRSLGLLSPRAKPYEMDPPVLKRTNKPGPWKNLLALHLRRGTDGYCESLGERTAPMVGYNQLPLLPGNENVPPPPDMVYATRIGLYKAKCNPATLDIIARARRLRANHPLLNSVYILSNGDDQYVEETRMWLLSDGWERVTVTGDVMTQWEDQEVAEAVDTEIARRSGVFVGNGFSTLSSNVALLRTRDGRPRDYTQYW